MRYHRRSGAMDGPHTEFWGRWRPADLARTLATTAVSHTASSQQPTRRSTEVCLHSKGAACTNSILPIIVISKVTLLLHISLHTMHSFIRLPTRVGLSHLVRSTHGFNSLNESIYKIYTFSIRNCNANATLSLWIGSYHIVIDNWISGYFSKSHSCEMQR